jgi:hypothetical protein
MISAYYQSISCSRKHSTSPQLAKLSWIERFYVAVVGHRNKRVANKTQRSDPILPIRCAQVPSTGGHNGRRNAKVVVKDGERHALNFQVRIGCQGSEQVFPTGVRPFEESKSAKAEKSLLGCGREGYPFCSLFGWRTEELPPSIENEVALTTPYDFDQFQSEPLVHRLNDVQACRYEPVMYPLTLRQTSVRIPPCQPSRVVHSLISVGDGSQRIHQVNLRAVESAVSPAACWLRGPVVKAKPFEQKRHGLLVSSHCYGEVGIVEIPVLSQLIVQFLKGRCS